MLPWIGRATKRILGAAQVNVCVYRVDRRVVICDRFCPRSNNTCSSDHRDSSWKTL